MKILNTFTAAMAVTILVSCGTPSTAPETADSSTAAAVPAPIKTTVLSAEEQAALTPDKVLLAKALKAGEHIQGATLSENNNIQIK